jgi:hypothetical protein
VENEAGIEERMTLEYASFVVGATVRCSLGSESRVETASAISAPTAIRP